MTDSRDGREPAATDTGGEPASSSAVSAGGEGGTAAADEAPALESAPSASEHPAWVLLTPLLPWLVALPGGNWLLPLAAPLTIYAAFTRRVKDRRYGAAWTLAMLWAALLSVGVIALVLVRPTLAAAGILHGPAYRAEMSEWIVSGVGKEVSPARFVPEHLLHLGAFMLLALVSGGYLGLVLGAFLMAYMSYFVGAFAAATGEPLTGALAAWVPWSVVRVMAFVLLGALLARPLLVRERRPSQGLIPRLPLGRVSRSTTSRLADGSPLWFGRREAWLFALAAAGIVTDLVVKTLLAPWWGRLLRQFLAPE